MNRRKLLTMLGLSPALVAGSPAYARTTSKPASHDSDVSTDSRVIVMNPAIPNRLAARFPLVSPLDKLDGSKTIYMINLSWEGPDAANYFYGAMREWLAQRYPGIKTVVKVTADGMFGTDAGILKDIAATNADAAIVGVAG